MTTSVKAPAQLLPHSKDCDCRLCRPRPLADDVPELGGPALPSLVAKAAALTAFVVARAKGVPTGPATFLAIGAGLVAEAARKKRGL